MLISHKDVLNSENQRECKKTKRWVAARSLNYRFEGWRERLRQAWGVFTGRYDAFDWDEDNVG